MGGTRNPDPIFSEYLAALSQDEFGEKAIQLIIEKGWAITEQVMLNPENDWTQVDLAMFIVLRPLLGPSVFTDAAIDRLQRLGWDDDSSEVRKLFNTLRSDDSSYPTAVRKYIAESGKEIPGELVDMVETLMSLGNVIRFGWAQQ